MPRKQFVNKGKIAMKRAFLIVIHDKLEFSNQISTLNHYIC